MDHFLPPQPPIASSALAYKYLVLDANALIAGGVAAGLAPRASRFVTVPEALAEVRDAAARAALARLPFPLESRAPSDDALAAVRAFAAATGDARTLSRTDALLLALALQLEREENGPRFVRDAPAARVTQLARPREWGAGGGRGGDGGARRAAGAGARPGGAAAAEAAGGGELAGNHDHECLDDHAGGGDGGGGAAEPPAGGRVVDVDDVGAAAAPPAAQGEGSETRGADGSAREVCERGADGGAEGGADVGDVNDADADGEEGGAGEDDGDAVDDGARAGAGGPGEPAGAGAAAGVDASAAAAAAGTAAAVDAADDGEGEWEGPTGADATVDSLFPADIPLGGAAGGGAGAGQPPRVMVGCVTTDFAMQNVLLQMGLLLVTHSGKVVTSVKQWVLKCDACFSIWPAGALTAAPDAIFCRACGNATLARLGVTLGADGAPRYHYNPRRRVNTRGTVYAIPEPRGGRLADGRSAVRAELLLRPDQLLMGGWQERARHEARADRSSLLADGGASGDAAGALGTAAGRAAARAGLGGAWLGPGAPGGAPAFGAPAIEPGWGRKNPNSNKTHKGRRRG